MARILIIEDEVAIADTLRLPLEQTYGHTLTHCETLHDAIRTYQQEHFDVILLDLNLPDGDGMDFCKLVRKQSSIPILILTARIDEVDRILGLELGADDYIVKPFSPREVGARINAVLRRGNWQNQKSGERMIRYCGIEIDEDRREVSVSGALVNLTKTEYDLLVTLMRRPGQVYSREQLMDIVWQGRFTIDRVVDSVVSRLRRKLGPMEDGNEWIRTVHGIGYSMARCPEQGNKGNY